MGKQLVDVGAMTVGKRNSALSRSKCNQVLSKKNSIAVAMLVLIEVARHLQLAAAASMKVADKEAGSFNHPGVLVSQEQLNLMKSRTKSHLEPMHSMFKRAQGSWFGSLDYKAEGPPDNGIIICGAYSNPNIGCKEDNHDSTAAYAQALLWYISGNKRYAQNAITLLNTYARKLKGFIHHNGPLQAAWSASKWTKAAEIIRHSNAGWAADDIKAFEKLLKKVYLHIIYGGSKNNGNWELAMIDGMMGIAVFTDDRKLFLHSIDLWKQRIPAYFFHFASDGRKPVTPPRGELFWYNQPVFDARVDGISQETCRDFGHLQMGLASTINAAETAMHQGIDLYSLQADRLMAAMEFHANLVMGVKVPNYVCGGHLIIFQKPTFEIAYAHFHDSLEKKLPKTLELIRFHRKNLKRLDDDRVMTLETLTHAAPDE